MTNIHTNNRNQQLDIIRGFSLLGILIVNMIGFHSPIMYFNPYDWFEYEDLTYYTWIDILAQGSFYPIFAILFGYGASLIYKNSVAKQLSYNKVMVKRLLVLMIFGMIHAFFIWAGDILIIYATMGLILIFFMKLSGKLLMRLGFVLYFLPQIFLSGVVIISLYLSGGSLADFEDIFSLQQAKLIYSEGSFIEITAQRYYDWTINYGFLNMFMFLFSVLPLMLIGAGAGKLNWLEQTQEKKRRYLLIAAICLPIGFGLKMIPFYTDTTIGMQYVQDSIGGPILAFGYIALIVLLTNKSLIQKLCKPFAAVGRMSLTVYILQSIFCTIIFYPYGFGIYGEITMKNATLLALCIFIVQAILAQIWFEKYKQGPLESIWRTFTYGKKRK